MSITTPGNELKVSSPLSLFILWQLIISPGWSYQPLIGPVFASSLFSYLLDMYVLLDFSWCRIQQQVTFYMVFFCRWSHIQHQRYLLRTKDNYYFLKHSFSFSFFLPFLLFLCWCLIRHHCYLSHTILFLLLICFRGG